MARIRSNNVFGTLSQAIDDDDETINAAGLANLAVVSGSDHAIITLDPNRVDGAPEIVKVTAHTGSATSATVTRGQFGTSARSHAAGTEWEHAPVGGTNGGGTIHDFLSINPPACRVTHSTTQSFNDDSEAAVLFDTETYDTDSMHNTSTNTSRITFNTPGIYAVSASGRFQASVTTTDAYLDIRLNGTTLIAAGTSVGAYVAAGFVRVNVALAGYKFAAGDYIEIMGFQNNSSNNARTLSNQTASATWIGAGD